MLFSSSINLNFFVLVCIQLLYYYTLNTPDFSLNVSQVFTRLVLHKNRLFFFFVFFCLFSFFESGTRQPSSVPWLVMNELFHLL